MSLFLETTKKDFIDKKMKIVESFYTRKNRLNNKKIIIPVFHMVWENGDKQQISKYSLDAFLEEVKNDIIKKQI